MLCEYDISFLSNPITHWWFVPMKLQCRPRTYPARKVCKPSSNRRCSHPARPFPPPQTSERQTRTGHDFPTEFCLAACQLFNCYLGTLLGIDLYIVSSRDNLSCHQASPDPGRGLLTNMGGWADGAASPQHPSTSSDPV